MRESASLACHPRPTASSPQSVTFSNMRTATDALAIGNITTSGDFKVTSNTCAASVPAGGQCTVSVVFKPSKTGTRKGARTIRDLNPSSPHIVTLTGTGTNPVLRMRID